jgi:hypothetical protein
MPKKKRIKNQETTEATSADASGETTTATATDTLAEPAATAGDAASVDRPAWIDGPPTPVNGYHTAAAEPVHGKNWGDPYKSIFNCREMGFELGENRRFKQRVFKFNLKPTDDVLAELKENGFTYRAGEKAWTTPANPDSRKLTDELARKWAGPDYIQGVER